MFNARRPEIHLDPTCHVLAIESARFPGVSPLLPAFLIRILSLTNVSKSVKKDKEK